MGRRGVDGEERSRWRERGVDGEERSRWGGEE